MVVYKEQVGKQIITNVRLQHLINKGSWIVCKQGNTYVTYTTSYIGHMSYSLVVSWLNKKMLFEYIKKKK